MSTEVTSVPPGRPVWVEPIDPADAERFGDWIHNNVLQVLEYLAAGGFGQCQSVLEMRQVADEAVASLRASIFGLHLQHRGDLQDSLTRLVSHAQAYGGIPIELAAFDVLDDPQPGAIEFLFDATREALMNVCRHSLATSASVMCRQQGGDIVVTVQDNGVGFDGRPHLAQRINPFGGSVSVDSAPGAGTSVTIAVPVETREISA